MESVRIIRISGADLLNVDPGSPCSLNFSDGFWRMVSCQTCQLDFYDQTVYISMLFAFECVLCISADAVASPNW